MGRRIILPVLSILLFGHTTFTQSHISMGGGYNQSLFYCALPKSTYYTSFRPYNSYLVNVSYKQNVAVESNNMRIGTQLEWKRQSAYFYYEDRRDNDTIPTGMRYDLHVVQLYVFPELVVGNPIRFIFSGGPCIEYILSSKANGIRLIDKKRVEVNENNNGDIKGLYIGAKLSVGMEFPVYKDFYISLSNSYSAGLSTKYGRLQKQMKYFNCIDINLTAAFCYQLPSNNKQK
ncbi:MAG: hypothetical protein WC142_08030 [Bacteroidales bacterium]|jgi:hypothetical protein|nr:hypothetical protein [Bacteroidales bacterium]MDD3331103.1 hypothetical protein [Bacteroidales bacterium]MDD3691742.1 hypothetical protein [Bacteroidales bacterium]MDD4045272.1 hypothetical protein [Bacteroidales bacterium]MDD4582264.1 hypothetical protein [Bacteroidales bacterium]